MGELEGGVFAGSDNIIALICTISHGQLPSSHGANTLNSAIICEEEEVSHRPGRRFRTNLMSRYICFSQNGRFDVRFEELVSKAKNPGGFLRKKRF